MAPALSNDTSMEEKIKFDKWKRTINKLKPKNKFRNKGQDLITNHSRTFLCHIQKVLFNDKHFFHYSPSKHKTNVKYKTNFAWQSCHFQAFMNSSKLILVITRLYRLQKNHHSLLFPWKYRRIDLLKIFVNEY